MNAPATHRQAAQRLRWERLHLVIRCGLHPAQPERVRVYLGLGGWLIRQGQLDEHPAQQRMLKLLLDTARDEALPWFWRSVCLEHTAPLLARLTTLLRRQAPAALQGLAGELQAAQAQLATSSRVPGPRQTETGGTSE